MRKRFRTFLAAILLSFSSLFATSCTGGSSIAGIRMASEEVIDVPFGNFSYDGIKVTVLFENGGNTEIDLTEDMISDVEQLKFFKMGEQDINVVFRDTFKTTMKVNVVMNEFNDIYELVGYTCVYDGNPHEVKLNHELPEGASIVYPKGNVFTNQGTYEVVGVITKSGYATKTLTTTLKILMNEHDEENIVFEDKTVPFNGEAQTIVAENVPEGVSVTYTLYDETKTTQLNKAYYAGKYCVVAHFTNEDPNYKQIEDKEAFLTITKIDYDLSEIKFLNVIKFYDGQSYQPSILNKELLPQGLTVHYEVYNSEGKLVNDNSPSGVYTMRAVFKGGDNNHNPIEPMEATLTVAKKIIYIKDTLEFTGVDVAFTGEAVSVADPTGLPNGVNFVIDQNDFTYVGEYPVVATFTAVDPNETVDIESMTVYALIKPSYTKVRVFDGLTNEDEPLYHDFTFADIKINVEENTATINTEKLRLGEGFENIECGIVIDKENEPLSFFQIVTDSTTSQELYIKVEPKDFVVGETYKFSVGFRLTNDDADIEAKLNESLSVVPCSGMFKYGKVNTKSDEYKYDSDFTASNISIQDNEACIVNVQTGVTAKSIKFYDPLTGLEIPDDELVVKNDPYQYKVSFNEQESFLFVDETGYFTYKNVKVKNSGGQYVDPFSTHNLLILDGVASTLDAEDGADIESLVLVDQADSSVVKVSDIEVGHTYDYKAFFTGISEIGSTPGTVWHQENGSFTFDRVKDLSTLQPITYKNISIEADEANIINIDPSIKVNYIKFYTGATEVAVSDLVAGQSYNYAVSFVSGDSTVYMLETGSLRVGGPVMGLGTGSEYNVPFSLSNLLITREGVADYDYTAKVIDINPDNHVRFIKFYDDNGDEVLDLNNIVFNNLYSYKVFFANDDGYNWQTAKGEFMFKRFMNGVAVFNAASNLRFKNGEAYLINFASGTEVVSIKIYDKESKNEVTDLKTMVEGNFYYYRVTFRSNDGRIYQEEMGDFLFTAEYKGS